MLNFSIRSQKKPKFQIKRRHPVKVWWIKDFADKLDPSWASRIISRENNQREKSGIQIGHTQ